jgi:transposase, IS5 family
LLQKTDADTQLHADSAYRSEQIEDTLQRRGVQSKIHEKGYRNQPLTKSQMRSNRAKSRIRARVEHVFAHITNCMNGFRIRSIGIVRARSNIGLINLTYNIVRSVYLQGA